MEPSQFKAPFTLSYRLNLANYTSLTHLSCLSIDKHAPLQENTYTNIMGKRIIASVLLLLFILAGLIHGYPLTTGLASQALPSQKLQEPSTSINIYLPLLLNKFPSPRVYGVETFEIADSRILSPLVQAGMYWVRRNGVLWNLVEPTKGTRDWSALANLDNELQIAALNNLQIILIVRGTPDWAQLHPGSVCGPIKPAEYAAFGQFVHDLVARYSQAPYFVKYYEIGNEPDVQWNNSDEPYGCWGEYQLPYFGAYPYADMLKVVYPQVKSASPAAQVVLGGLLLDCDPNNPPEVPPGSGKYKDCSSSLFLKGVLEHRGANDGGNYFDVVSFHAYDYYLIPDNQVSRYYNPNWNSSSETTGPVFLAKLNFLRSLLTQYGYADKPIMSTELSLLCNEGCDKEFEQTKAFYAAQAYAASIAEGLKANVWFDAGGSWRNSGLFSDTKEPQPALFAYHASRQELALAKYISTITAYPNVQGYEFIRGNRRVWVLWTMDSQTHKITLPSAPVVIRDYLGYYLPPSSSITLYKSLVYLEWN